MPYVSQKVRKRLEFGLERPSTPGELNYCITRLVLDYLQEEPDYERYNAAIGALECAKLELYRRRIASYEDQKIKDNGDVY